MKTRISLLALLCVAGFTAAALSFPGGASAWDWHTLPNGYPESVVTYTDPSTGDRCTKVTINGQYMGDTCHDDVTAAVNTYVDATICTVNLAAGQAQGMCAPPATTTVTTTTTAATTTAAPVTTNAAPTGSGTPATTTVVVTTTTEVTTTTADAALTARVTALETRVTALEVNASRQAALASHTAVIDEAKNVAPFTNPG